MGISSSKTDSESVNDMASAMKIVDEAIANNRVMVFSKSYCPFCTKAKRALGTLLPANAITVMELETRSDCAAIQDYLLDLTGGRSVPRVFVDGEFIGGGDETESMVRSGRMEALLKEKGIIAA